MADTTLEPTAFAFTDQHTILRVTYDVIVSTGEARHIVAKDQTSTVAVTDEVYGRCRALLSDIGHRMDDAVGLAVPAQKDDFLNDKTAKLKNEDL